MLDTLRAASRRGVRIRLLYNVDRRPPGKVAPPPPKTRADEIEALPFETLGMPGWPDLMHHKYVVRDGASVWTGSTNWTDDSWSREENVIAVVDSAAVAARYSEDFEQLRRRQQVRRSGKVSTRARGRHPCLVLAEARRGGSHTGSRTRSVAPSGACGSRRR